MAASNKVVLGMFSSQEDAERVIHDLERNGYNPKDVSIVMRDTRASHDVAKRTGASTTDAVTSGAVTGGLIGGLAGLLIGVGAIALPGIGGILIAGPIAAALGLTGAAATTISGTVTGALAGGIIGALVSLGVPEQQARVYEQRIREGAILLLVPVGNRVETFVSDVMEKYGVQDMQTITMVQPAYQSDRLDSATGRGYEQRRVGFAGGMVSDDDTKLEEDEIDD